MILRMSDDGSRIVFGRDEYAARLARVRSELDRRGLAGLVVTSPESMYYLTGYDAASWYVPQAVIVAVDRSPMWVGRGMDVNCARHSTWLDPADLHGYDDTYVDAADRHAAEVIGDLAGEAMPSGVIGVEVDSYFFTGRAWDVLRSVLPGRSLVDCSRLVDQVRMTKSPDEVRAMRRAGDIAVRGMRRARDCIRAGVRENDAAAEILAALVTGSPAYGGDAAPTLPLMLSGQRTNCPHLTWTDQPFGTDVVVNVELGGSHRHYNAGMSRSFALGRPPAAMQSLADGTVAAVERTLPRIVPGRTCGEIADAWNEELAARGLTKASRVGYGIGIGLVPVWIERSASLRPGDPTVLEPSMTFHLMAGIWRDADGFVCSETLLITEDGCDVLTPFERGLLTPG